MRYATARYREYVQELAYRVYMSDSIYVYSDGKRLTHRFYDGIRPNMDTSEIADEIALDVIQHLGLRIENNERI